MNYPISLREARDARISRTRLRSGAWRRVGVGLYAPAVLPDEPELRLRAAMKRLPTDAVFSDRTAGWLHGMDLPPCSPPQAIVVPGGGVWERSGVAVRRAGLAADDVVEVNGFRVTSPLRTVVDLAARLPRFEAVVATDMALHRSLVDLAALQQWARESGGRKGVRQVRWVASVADRGAESPMETRLRLLLLAARQPRPDTQVALYDQAGRFLARVDLYYQDARLAIEYDGAGHREQLAQDNRRQNRIIAAGFTVLRYSSTDFDDPAKIVAEVKAARRKAARLAKSMQMAALGEPGTAKSMQMARGRVA